MPRLRGARAFSLNQTFTTEDTMTGVSCRDGRCVRVKSPHAHHRRKRDRFEMVGAVFLQSKCSPTIIGLVSLCSPFTVCTLAASHRFLFQIECVEFAAFSLLPCCWCVLPVRLVLLSAPSA